MITIILEEQLKQGTAEWHNLRNHFLTGTDAIKLLRGYTPQQILQAKIKESNSFKGNYWTNRGHLLEDESKDIYSQVYSPITNAGFIINDKTSQNIGYSPDGLVGDDGFVECKCFGEKHHLQVAKTLSPEIIAQTQWGFFITERDWCDLLLYNPDIEDNSLAYIVKRLSPIPEIQEKFKKLLDL